MNARFRYMLSLSIKNSSLAISPNEMVNELIEIEEQGNDERFNSN